MELRLCYRGVYRCVARGFQHPLGGGQVATHLVCLSYGSRVRHGSALSGQASLILGIGFMVLTAAIMWLFPRAVLSIYIDVDAARNVALVGYAMQFLVIAAAFQLFDGAQTVRSEEHTSELQSLMRISYAVFCLTKKTIM